MEKLAGLWKARHSEKHVAKAVEILGEKFPSLDGFGPSQVVEFFNSPNPEEREMQARKAFELVQKFLGML